MYEFSYLVLGYIYGIISVLVVAVTIALIKYLFGKFRRKKDCRLEVKGE